MKHYIIDGNNLIGKIRKLSGLQINDKQGAREKLAYLLQNHFTGKKIKMTLNFDGYENIKINFQIGKIIYSESRTADEKIKEQVSSSKNRKNLIVVSSDNEIRNFAQACGCSIITSEEFYQSISSENQSDDEEKRIKEMDDIEEFKRLFNVKNNK